MRSGGLDRADRLCFTGAVDDVFAPTAHTAGRRDLRGLLLAAGVFGLAAFVAAALIGLPLFWLIDTSDSGSTEAEMPMVVGAALVTAALTGAMASILGVMSWALPHRRPWLAGGLVAVGTHVGQGVAMVVFVALMATLSDFPTSAVDVLLGFLAVSVGGTMVLGLATVPLGGLCGWFLAEVLDAPPGGRRPDAPPTAETAA